ncbi:MAG: hypothetical protein CM15mP80_08120 [Alphaproteobacteria bacterium]|nr:MAG: hypothetical protein CM15mP80_08120 [Alphaproteobacteria bacterium]
MWGQNPRCQVELDIFYVFFKLVPEEEFSKDCFMKQKPFNDNLVMASIESLYEQASHTVRPNTDGLRRHNPRDLPIIGSLPVQIGQQEGVSEYDDIVLTGRLHAAFADDNRTKVSAKTDPDKEQEANPFLEIRQAVIAAGNKNNQKLERPEPSAQEKSDPDTASTNTPTSVLPDELEVKSTEQTFAKHLANLIDAEIERRMAVRMQAIKKASNKNTSAKKTSSKQRKMAKTSKKTKEKAARKSAPKRPSTAKRTKPK